MENNKLRIRKQIDCTEQVRVQRIFFVDDPYFAHECESMAFPSDNAGESESGNGKDRDPFAKWLARLIDSSEVRLSALIQEGRERIEQLIEKEHRISREQMTKMHEDNQEIHRQHIQIDRAMVTAQQEFRAQLHEMNERHAQERRDDAARLRELLERIFKVAPN